MATILIPKHHYLKNDLIIPCKEKTIRGSAVPVEISANESRRNLLLRALSAKKSLSQAFDNQFSATL